MRAKDLIRELRKLPPDMELVRDFPGPDAQFISVNGVMQFHVEEVGASLFDTADGRKRGTYKVAYIW